MPSLRDFVTQRTGEIDAARDAISAKLTELEAEKQRLGAMLNDIPVELHSIEMSVLEKVHAVFTSGS